MIFGKRNASKVRPVLTPAEVGPESAAVLTTHEELARLAIAMSLSPRALRRRVAVLPINTPDLARNAAAVWAATETAPGATADPDVIQSRAEWLELGGAFDPNAVVVVAHEKRWGAPRRNAELVITLTRLRCDEDQQVRSEAQLHQSE